jgi:hypothetical protein
MAEEYGCEQVRSLLVELATGVLTGHERGLALRHVAGCASCRQELAALAQVADSLLLLAPVAEPAAGFEGRVMARLGAAAWPQPETTVDATRATDLTGAAVGTTGPAMPTAAPAGHHRPAFWRRRPARWPRLPTRAALAAALAVVVAAVLAGSAVYWRAGQDRQLADQYRHTLTVADGRYLTAATLTTDAGAVAGTVFLYEGRPSWVLASVRAAPADGAYAMTVIDRHGVSHPVGVCPVARGHGTSGYTLYMHVADVAAVHLRGPGGEQLTARTA